MNGGKRTFVYCPWRLTVRAMGICGGDKYWLNPMGKEEISEWG